MDNNITLQYVNEEVSRLHSEKEDIEQHIKELELIEQDKSKIYDKLSSLQEKLSDFSRTFDLMPIDDKRTALRKLVKTVLWDGNTVHLYLTGSEDSFSDTEILDILKPMERRCK